MADEQNNQSPPAPDPVICWLIEMAGPAWLSVDSFPKRSWTPDAAKAIRFVGQRDAIAIIQLFGITPATATEHLFE